MNAMTALGTALTALTLAIGVGVAPAGAQDASKSFEVLKGKWVRPDGGYVIAISGVAADGKLDATYANVGSSRVDLQACKLEYSIVSPK